MAIVLIWQRSTPGQLQYGLATLTEHYKVQNDDGSQITAAAALLAGPALGAAHPTYSTMFCTDRYCAETGESASALDVTYMGIFGMDLPPQKATSGGQIASVSTNTDADIFPATTTNPLTLNYYSITNTLSFYSTDPDDASEPTDPPLIATTDFVSWDLGFGGQPAGSFPALEAYWLASALVQRIVEPPPDIDEVVSGQFYQITKRKTRTLFPYSPAS